MKDILKCLNVPSSRNLFPGFGLLRNEWIGENEMLCTLWDTNNK